MEPHCSAITILPNGSRLNSVDRYQPTHHALRHTARTDLTLPRNEKPLCYCCLYPRPIPRNKLVKLACIFSTSLHSLRGFLMAVKKKKEKKEELRFYLFFTPCTTSMVFLHASGSIGKTACVQFFSRVI